MKVVIITGMSGAGRSTAADWFEDQGYYCVDNIPPKLIKYFIEMAEKDTNTIDKVAFVADVRSSDFFESMGDVIDSLKDNVGLEVKVVFLEASASDLVKRYSAARRKHPLSDGEASKDIIEDERAKLKPIRKRADYIIDTTRLKASELYTELDSIFYGGKGARSFAINISSFGFKYGIPSEADIMFDVRFLANPYYVKSLQKLTGNNKKVVEYIFKDPLAEQFVESIHAMLELLIPGYIEEGKYHINIAFGCTGGHHRSVAIANAVAKSFANEKIRVRVSHRDMDLQAKGK